MTSIREGKAIANKTLAQRQLLWPGIEPFLWHRTANKGFATIPKTMPLILQILDDLGNGKRLSPTYLGLWCSTWDNSMVNISRPGEMAHAAGFTGERATYTWSARIKLLQELEFIDVKPGRSGPISHVLIWNPHYAIRHHRNSNTPGLIEGNFNALLERALEVGAKDMLEELPASVAAPQPPIAPVAADKSAPPSSPPAESAAPAEAAE